VKWLTTTQSYYSNYWQLELLTVERRVVVKFSINKSFGYLGDNVEHCLELVLHRRKQMCSCNHTDRVCREPHSVAWAYNLHSSHNWATLLLGTQLGRCLLPHLRTETDPVSEALRFLVFRIPDNGQSPKPSNSYSLAPEDYCVGSTFLRNVNIRVHLPDCAASHPRTGNFHSHHPEDLKSYS
jgi:hypothetical protein